MVRRVGPRLPLRRARARRPGLREVPADPALPRVVPAPERRARRLRVVVRRRQPAGPGLGGARGVRDRRRARPRLPRAASSTSCSSTSRGGSTARIADGSNLFEGGFLGLDNIGPIDRSHLPAGHAARAVRRHRAGWRSTRSACSRSRRSCNRSGRPADRPGREVPRALRAHLRGAAFARACGTRRTGSSTTGSAAPDGSSRAGARCARSSASCRCSPSSIVDDARRSSASSASTSGSAGLLDDRRARSTRLDRRSGCWCPTPETAGCCSASSASNACSALLRRLFDEEEFLSPYGLRAVSRYHVEHPFELELDGTPSTIDYEPAESTTGMFGGNSNWRGPVWFPVNYLVVSALAALRALLRRRLHASSTRPARGERLTLDESPTTSGDRLISLFLVGDGRAAAVLRLGRPAPERPGLEGQHRCSTSTSTATTARASAPRTRPAGRASSPT